ncbi:hypothetical protein PBI_MRMAGOO_130 [Mycobacterium phage MrMagoo]|uniref:Uncharacterized protein n=1 Tax=Mycobacterium phage MrMagoo TaxID=1927020 RepID=A0A1L6BYN3_9CAUD|nr:hypothetical protein J4U04_gp150 [Mycobacterium phage MrMagoo]APQ42212.1 hypothetical protein PBI_MRMAGOO_130 [Mycobacterium phage MrMagoo]ARM70285.1 hypothetical protein SEA_GARDENSALSA_129 [Mycobacterium phage GardenSalsa]
MPALGALTVKPYPGQEMWVQALADGDYEIGVQFNRDQYTMIEVNREALEQLSTNIIAVLLDTGL